MGIGEIEIDKEIVSIFFVCFVFVFLFGWGKSKQTGRRVRA